MNRVKYSILILLLMLTQGCAANNAISPEMLSSKYSLEVEGVSDSVITDGLPEGTNAANIYKSIQNNIENSLAEQGLKKSDNPNRLKLRYVIMFFGHKWKGLHVKYIMIYKVQLIEVSSNKIIASDENDHMDEDLLTVINRTSKYIVRFAKRNILLI